MNEEWVSDWPTGCRAILDDITRDPRFAEAVGDAKFYKTNVCKEVRIGWTDRKTGRGNTILAVIRCRGDSGLMIRLNVGAESGLIADEGPLRPSRQDPNPARGDCNLTGSSIPADLFEWLRTARIYTRS